LHLGHLNFFFSYSEIFMSRLKDLLHFSQINSYLGIVNLLFEKRFKGLKYKIVIRAADNS